MNSDQFRAAAHAAIEEIIAHHSSVADSSRQVLPDIKPGYLKTRLPTSAPPHPQSWPQIQPDISAHIIPGLTNWQSPNFLAFFPANTTYPSILGEMYSSAFNAPAFNWLCSPACTELETVVMDWLCDALHLPNAFRSDQSSTTMDGRTVRGGGVIQGSASEAVVTVMVAARERYTRRRCEAEGLKEGTKEWDDHTADLRSKLVALSSDQAHSSTAKGARIVGTRYRTIPTTWEGGLVCTPNKLEEVIEQCVAEGLQPYYITLTYGTTNTCAQDPLLDLAPVFEKYPDIWIHVDAAYAGTALICPEYANATVADSNAANTPLAQLGNALEDMKRLAMNGAPEELGQRLTNGTTDTSTTQKVSSVPLPSPAGCLSQGPQQWLIADSFNTNLHKWLLVSFDASILYVKDRHSLTTALSIQPAYLQNRHTESGLVTDYRDWQIPLGRRFRALKIWFVLRTYGIEGLRAHIRRTVRVGEYFTGLIDGPDGRQLFELVTKPAFGLTCFRIKPERIPDELLHDALETNGAGPLENDTEAKATVEGTPFGAADSLDQPSGNTKGSDASRTTRTLSQLAKAEELANTFSKQVVEEINDSGKLFLTASSTGGKSFIRVVNGTENSSEESMKSAFDIVVATTHQLIHRAMKEIISR